MLRLILAGRERVKDYANGIILRRRQGAKRGAKLQDAGERGLLGYCLRATFPVFNGLSILRNRRSII